MATHHFPPSTFEAEHGLVDDGPTVYSDDAPDTEFRDPDYDDVFRDADADDSGSQE